MLIEYTWTNSTNADVEKIDYISAMREAALIVIAITAGPPPGDPE